MNEVEEYYVKHFGVKGMKWGVRKKRKTNKATGGASKSERKQTKQAKEANKKATKANNWNARANRIGALALLTLSVAADLYPEATYAGASAVGSAVGGAASTAGMYAKYASKAAVPVSRTVKNRGYIDAMLVNSGNAVGFAR